MKAAQPSWDDLNAYVDGELSNERAAELAAALGRDPELAEQVAALHRLKSASQGLVEAAPVALPAGKAAAPLWPRSAVALAAALVVVLLLGAAWNAFAPTPARHVVWAGQAWDAHRQAAAAEASQDTASQDTASQDTASQDPASQDPASQDPASQDQASAMRAAQRHLGPLAFVPDLRSAGLTLVRLSAGPGFDGRNSLHLGYRGQRGCRLSLFVLEGGIGLDEGLRDLAPELGAGAAASGRQAVAWQSGGFSNLLLAEGMDPLRFAEISRRVYHASLEQRPFDAETRLALQRSREESQRCQV